MTLALVFFAGTLVGVLLVLAALYLVFSVGPDYSEQE
jgi:uncharacterized membrane protein YccC